MTIEINRRALVTGAGSLMLAAHTPSAMAATAPGPIKPRRLREGDTVGLIEPAGFTDDAFDLDLVEDTIRAMGLKPKRAPHLIDRFGYLAGKDADRASDVNVMFADPAISAIFAVLAITGLPRSSAISLSPSSKREDWPAASMTSAVEASALRFCI